ncbi:MAG: fasciclin domain-containing protein, partial [Myxococcota bacterium]|nr:fasciclin domain-containing protein [Myxococcota bacterium]
LSGEGPFTVFAPSDDAFAALIADIGQEAFDAIVADTEQLTGILNLHVVAGTAVSAAEVVGLENVTTLGGDLPIVVGEDGSVTVGGAVVSSTDIQASNGIIHVIDSVILPATPEGPGTITEVAEGAGTFTTLLTAVDAAGLRETLNGEGPFTVFAPSDDAFAALIADIGQEAFDAIVADTEQLTAILNLHVVAGTAVSAAEVVELDTVTTLGGDLPVVVGEDGGVTIGGAVVSATDVQASNGVIHVIDTVILPAE